jgi:hypothetical protein
MRPLGGKRLVRAAKARTVSWEAVTALSTAFTGVVIGVTAVAGVAQLRQLRAQRRDSAAVELMRSLQDSEFIRAFGLIMSLPAGVRADELRSRGREYTDAAFIIGLRLEMLGVLVYRGAIAFDVTEDLAGGGIVSMWIRLKDFARATRDEQQYPMYLEWFQWLAEQYERRDRLQQTPAHERHRSWTPG